METVKLSEVCALKTGKTPPSKEEKYFDGDVNWYTPTDLDRDKILSKSKRTITNLAFEEKKAVVFQPNTLLMTCIGDIAKIGITNDLCSSNQQITALIPNDLLDVNYLYYIIKSKKTFLQAYANNAVVPILNNKNLAKIKIPLPPLPEQQRIANILDTAADLKNKTQALLTAYDSLAQSIFSDMFDKQDGVLTELGEVIKLIGGGTPSKANDLYWDGNVPWASVKDLKSDILIKTQDTISMLGVENSSTKIIPKGSLIVSTRMAVGKAVITGIDVAINQDLKGVVVIGEINVHYLFHLFKSKLSYFESVSTGATVKGIKIEHITKLKIVLPPIELQNEFAKKIENIEQQKALAQQELEQAENLFNGLLQKAFKGEL